MPKPKYQPFDWKALSVLPSDHNAPDAQMDDLISSLEFNTTSNPSKRFKPSSSEIVHLPPSGKPTIDLPIEIILNIVEQMCWDPISIGKFMRTSKVCLTSTDIPVNHTNTNRPAQIQSSTTKLLCA